MLSLFGSLVLGSCARSRCGGCLRHHVLHPSPEHLPAAGGARPHLHPISAIAGHSTHPSACSCLKTGHESSRARHWQRALPSSCAVGLFQRPGLSSESVLSPSSSHSLGPLTQLQAPICSCGVPSGRSWTAGVRPPGAREAGPRTLSTSQQLCALWPSVRIRTQELRAPPLPRCAPGPSQTPPHRTTPFPS